MMLGVKPARVRDDSSGKIVKQYWEPAKKHLLTDPRFLQRLRDFDKDNIPQSIIDKVEPFCSNPDFEPDVIIKASKAANLHSILTENGRRSTEN